MPESTPLISVIIPCFNAERYIAATLQSVLWQTEQRWECLVVDDGSTDRSREIVTEYQRKDHRVRLITQPNSGPTAARNNGVRHSSGEFIQFLDADDILFPERFEKCLRRFAEQPDLHAVYSDFVLYRTGEGFLQTLPAKIPGNDPVKAMLFDLNVTFVILMHAWLFRRECVVSTPFDIAFPIWSEDQDCWIRMAMKKYSFGYVDAVLVLYRFTENNLTSRESDLITAKLSMMERYRSKPELRHYHEEFASAQMYFRQRLVMGYFMEKSFSKGLRTMMPLIGKSSVSALLKMAGWGILMVFFSKRFVAEMREWIVTRTPWKWGGWKTARPWNAPKYLTDLLEGPTV